MLDPKEIIDRLRGGSSIEDQQVAADMIEGMYILGIQRTSEIMAVEAERDMLLLEVKGYQFALQHAQQALAERGMSLADQRAALLRAQAGEAAPEQPQEGHRRWYYSAEKEDGTWLCACATREEAIAAGRADENIGGAGFYICPASNPPLRLADFAISGPDFLEHASETLWDSDRVCAEWDDGNEFHVKPEQANDLTQRLRKSCDEWQAANGLQFWANTFEIMGHIEAVPPASEKEGL